MPRLADRLYGLLLRIYPAPFRRLYQAEMHEAFRQLYAWTSEREGPAGLVRLWIRTAWDALGSGLRERLSRRGYRIGFRSRLRIPRPSLSTVVGDLIRDLQLATRTLARSPTYTLAVVLTLALGIGANSAVFSVIHGVLIDPLPFPNGEQVVRIRQSRVGVAGEESIAFSVKELEDYRTRTASIAEIAEYHSMTFNLTGLGEPDRVTVGVVSHNFFDLLGVRPALGREFVAAEDRAGAAPVLVLGHAYWAERFGSDPNVVGQIVTMNSMPHRIVGVLPDYPQFPAERDVYMPVSVCPTRSNPVVIANREHRMVSAYGRLVPDVAPSEGAVDVAYVAEWLQDEYPEFYDNLDGFRADLNPVREEMVAQARPSLLLLFGAAGLVLLIACANAANLALARANRRLHETAVRSVLGAGRTRIARQLLTEHVLLGVLGGAVGLSLAAVGVDVLASFAARFTTRAGEVSLDGPVLWFTLTASIVTGLLFGAAPAAVRRSTLLPALADAGAATQGRRRRRAHRLLVIGQVAVAFALLNGAGLLLRSFWAVRTQDPGFDMEEVVSFRATLDDNRYRAVGTRIEFFDELKARLEEVPGVVVAAQSMEVPLTSRQRPYIVQEWDAEVGRWGPETLATERRVGVGYFEAIGVELLEGRDFGLEDDGDAPHRAVVNRTFARRQFPNGAAVGRTVRACLDSECTPDLTIVGVVDDMLTDGLEQPVPAEVYRTARQLDWGGEEVVVRTRGGSGEVMPVVAQVVHSIDPTIPVTGIQTLEELRRETLAARRITTLLLLLFAGVALALTLAGLFGVLSLSVSARASELGIRRALGARAEEVSAMVIAEGMRLLAVGLVLGFGLAALLTRAMRGLLWGVESTDMVTVFWATVVFVLTALLACWLPVRRVTGMEVTTTLRTA